MSRLRLAVVLDRWRPGAGGLEAWAAAVLPRLAERQDLWLVARGASSSPPPGCRPREARSVLPLPRPLRDLADARAQESAVRALAPDRVLVLRSVPVSGAYWLPHGGSAPDLAAARGAGPRSLKQRVLDALEANTLALSAGAFAPSPKVAAELAARRPDLPCTVLPPPLVAPVPDPGPPADPPRLLFCGRDARLKGAARALACFRLLRKEHPGALLEMWARSSAHLERCLGAPAAKLEAEGVRLQGWDGRFRERLAQAGLLLHPTRYDSCSLVCLEALAAGVAVLTTPAAGVAGLIHSPLLACGGADAEEDADIAVRLLERRRDPALVEAASAEVRGAHALEAYVRRLAAALERGRA